MWYRIAEHMQTEIHPWRSLEGKAPLEGGWVQSLIITFVRVSSPMYWPVIASLVVQGWTVGSAARLLGFARRG
jgi:hypothetical protein